MTEAILELGGEAAAARQPYASFPPDDQRALIVFLENLVPFTIEEDEVAIPPPPTLRLRAGRGGQKVSR